MGKRAVQHILRKGCYSLPLLLLFFAAVSYAQTVKREVISLEEYRARQRQASARPVLRARPGQMRSAMAAPVMVAPPPMMMSAPPPPMQIAAPAPVAMAPAPVFVPAPVGMPVAQAAPMAPRMADIPPPVRRAAPAVPMPISSAAAPPQGGYFDSREFQASRHATPPALDVAFSTGFRRGDASYRTMRVIDPIQDVRDIVNMDWKSLSAYQFRGDASYTQRWGWLKGLRLEGSGYTSKTFAGDLKIDADTIQAGQDQTLAARVEADADDEGNTGFQGAVGYSIQLTDETISDNANKTISLIPMVGYGVDRQTFFGSQYNQTFPAVGPLAGSGIEYEMEWKGPFIGLELESYIDRNTYHLSLRGQYHFGDLTGNGVERIPPPGSPLLTSIISQEADATGLVFNARAGYFVLENLELFTMLNYSRWTSDGGSHLEQYSTGAERRFELEEAESRSTDLMVGAALRW